MTELFTAQDPIPALDRAMAGAVRIYDSVRDEPKLCTEVLLLIAHIRLARKQAE